MSNTDVATLFALCAALAAAIGSVIRQRSAQLVTDKPVGHLALFGMLLRDVRWWLGGMGDIASYCLIAAALDHGSVMLVTALQVTVILFALPIYARVTGHRITGREWMWAILLAAALAVVVTVGDPTAGESRGSLEAWIVVALVMGPALGYVFWRPDLVGSAGCCGAAGGGVGLVVGAVRGADQGHCRRA
ncbi:multidrug resistance efflux transporter family protein [Mycobacterium xenopi 3993]|nr:multidrug resistance efflux transporter family protein [Mycobacterium xenopi 3993]